jgi:hypothetical protein
MENKYYKYKYVITRAMNLIIASEKDFENIALKHDPAYIGIEDLITQLIEFIRERGLIIYGGLAIDYAMRLCGDKLYPDDMLQIDYDFMSPNHIEHSYDLADIFYAAVREVHGDEAAEGVRAINALHVKTMRVDIRDNHFLADVTYCPADIFPQIPTLNYQGIKIIHPDIQRIDIHSSLSFPYDFPPMEVIFARWKKDVTRFKMLAKYYPITMPILGGSKVRAESAVGNMEIPENVSRYVLTGFSAYGIMYQYVRNVHGSLPANIIPAESELLYGNVLEIAHFDPEKCEKELALAHTQKFRPVINMIPEITTGMAKFGKVKIESTRGRLLSYVSAVVGGTTYRLACVQYILRQFLSEYHRAKMSNDPRADLFLAHYVSTMNLMEFENGRTNSSGNSSNITRLSVVTYGADNTSLSKEVGMKRVLADMGLGVSEYLPNNYYPAKKREDSARPQYDISRNVIFDESGQEIK